jgi:NAD(P)-dependent dehydrogenase (short-subunit alcohol dehydrogenase family)
VKLFGEKGGSIINIGTAGARNPGLVMVLYLSTKGAIDIVTEGLAKDLGPKKIRINSINPRRPRALTLVVMGSEFEKHLISQTPLRRFGQPEDITPVAVFLRSEASFWVRGEILLQEDRKSGGHFGVATNLRKLPFIVDNSRLDDSKRTVGRSRGRGHCCFDFSQRR